ncbi:AB hydrolase-1 domain-containing protein [Mycena venus]|uniref:AB hydrolase-1 domain-containing protein n=1 Tax=Mycena venus TaxID=2733690 RepID=A0A8H6Y0Z6_9AGAR|nr:AB hydrolase-1 domain-containing protein [Mycena venus]
MALETTSFIFDCPQNANDPVGQVLKMSATQYYTPHSVRNSQGLVLLFSHCIGAHKEQWEPTIHRIFELRSSAVREAWAFDRQTHGESAILNRELLETSPSRVYGVSAFEWSEAIAAFVDSPRMQGKRIVPIGHSAGGAAMVLTTRDKPLSAIPYVSLILIEPTVVPRGLYYLHVDDLASTMQFVVMATASRRERWRSREDAHAWLSRRVPWDSWDPRVLRKFTEYGLADTPDGGVMIKGDRKQEALSYADVEPQFAAAQELGRISRTVPVHFIWGSGSPVVPEFVQDALCDGSDGRVVGSVTRLEGEHMLVQEQPDSLADAICAILDTIGDRNGRKAGQSKL